MTGEPVLLDVEHRIANVRLNRPQVANALDLPTARRLRDIAVELSSRTDVSVVVLSAEGEMFCAGGDVAAMAAADDRGAFVFELATTVHQALVALRALRLPVVAAVQGIAAGAGVGLTLAADLVLASDRARFISAYGDVGLSPDCGVSALLAHAIGPRRAAAFALTGRVIDAALALEWGLVSEVSPHEDLAVAVRSCVGGLLDRPAAALGATALLLRRSAERTYDEQLRDEAESIAGLSVSPDAAARLARFAARRSG